MKKLFFSLILVAFAAASCHSPGVRLPKGQLIATLSYGAQGCFYSEQVILSLVGDQTNVQAVLTSAGKIIARTAIAYEELKTFEELVREINALPEGGLCTTVTSYEVHYKGRKIRKNYGHCKWDGFERYRQSLFGGR